jgi:hypothetical protein
LWHIPVVRQKADLARAEYHIADGERRIAGQMLRIEELRADGHDTREAEHLLGTMQGLMVQFYAHQNEILRELSG